MKRRSKRYKEALELTQQKDSYTYAEAIDLLKKIPSAKFDETVEIVCNLGVDPKKSDQMVRSSCILPYGTGKKVKVLVFCEPEKEQEAKDAGADFVGSQDLADKIIKENWIDFDYCIATPSMMRVVSKLGKTLGPRGLMPSTKTGTITPNIGHAVEEAKKGKLNFKMDKLGSVHAGIGKLSFPAENLIKNLEAFLESLNNARPQSAKGEYIRSIYISTSMGPAVKVG